MSHHLERITKSTPKYIIPYMEDFYGYRHFNPDYVFDAKTDSDLATLFEHQRQVAISRHNRTTQEYFSQAWAATTKVGQFIFGFSEPEIYYPDLRHLLDISSFAPDNRRKKRHLAELDYLKIHYTPKSDSVENRFFQLLTREIGPIIDEDELDMRDMLDEIANRAMFR